MRRSLPNIITVSRVAAAPVVAFLVWQEPEPALRWWGLGLFALAAVTDFLDGWIARRWQVVSPFGRMLDPIADKLLIVAVILALAAQQPSGWLFMLPSLVILFREFLVAGLREFLAGAEIVLAVTLMAKWKTALQMVALGILIIAPILDQMGPDQEGWLQTGGLLLYWVSAVMTALTGISYFHAARKYL